MRRFFPQPIPFRVTILGKNGVKVRITSVVRLSRYYTQEGEKKKLSD